METRWTAWLRSIAVLAWIAGWVLLLWVVASPWGDLGGLVSEQLRWFQRFALWMGLVVGHLAGAYACRAAALSGRRARAIRWLLYPASVIAAASMVRLIASGDDDTIGVVLSAWLSYTAGATSALLGIGMPPPDEPATDQLPEEP
jgi:hypothetical protein